MSLSMGRSSHERRTEPLRRGKNGKGFLNKISDDVSVGDFTVLFDILNRLPPRLLIGYLVED